MLDDLETLFKKLEPPPGGIAGLHRRLQYEPRRRRTRVAALGLAGAVAVVGLLLTVHRRVAPSDKPPVADFHPALVSLGLQDAPREPAVIPPSMRHRMALLRVPLESDRVVFYYVAVLPATSSDQAEAGEDQDRRPGDSDADRLDDLGVSPPY